MEMKITVSQAAHANRVLLAKILPAHAPPPSSAGNAEEREAFNLAMLSRRQEAGEELVAALPVSERAILELFA
jgi:hypothetical protein